MRGVCLQQERVSVNESDASRVVCKYGSVSDTLRSMQPLPEYMDVNLAYLEMRLHKLVVCATLTLPRR